MLNYKENGICWLKICRNCKYTNEEYLGISISVHKNIYEYIKDLPSLVDKFSVATHAKDIEVIDKLYENLVLGEYEQAKLDRIKKNNSGYRLTLNIGILDKKYEFLDSILDILVIDTFTQDRILSLDDYKLFLFKRIFERIKEYEINPNDLLYDVLLSIGASSIPGRNSQIHIEICNEVMEKLQESEKTKELTKEEIDSFIFYSNIGLSNIKSRNDLTNFNQVMKKDLLECLNSCNDINVIKEKLYLILYNLGKLETERLLSSFNFDNMPEEFSNDEAVIEYNTLKFIFEEEDINVLKEIFIDLLENEKFTITPYRALVLKENLINLYAKDYNKCTFNFTDDKLLFDVDGIKFYNAGLNFIIKVKSVGAFSKESLESKNYSLEWNDDRYFSHINAISLIANNNLAYANLGDDNLIVGFNEFFENMLLGASENDQNTLPDSREFSTKNIFSRFYFAKEMINKTRQSHNEIDYERKDLNPDAIKFKKNPDFIVFIEERIDNTKLTEKEVEKRNKMLKKSIQAAKDFKLPILVINREKCAINETRIIQEELLKYNDNNDFNNIKNAIIRFCSNRNGCRLGHEYIRNTYFSNSKFAEMIEKIKRMITSEDIPNLISLLEEEIKLSEFNIYDKTYDIEFDRYICEFKNIKNL